MPTPLFLPGETLSASKLQQLGDERTFTPELNAGTSAVDLGTGADATGRIWINGQHITVWFSIEFGTSPTVPTGQFNVRTPIGFPPDPSIQTWPVCVGLARLDVFVIRTAMIDLFQNRLYMREADGALVDFDSPGTFSAGDRITGTANYQTA